MFTSGGSKVGRKGRAIPPWGPNSFNFMQFLGKFGKIVCWRPLLGEILDPPLFTLDISVDASIDAIGSVQNPMADDLHSKILDVYTLSVHFFWFSWSFWGNLAKQQVSTPLLGRCPPGKSWICRWEPKWFLALVLVLTLTLWSEWWNWNQCRSILEESPC